MEEIQVLRNKWFLLSGIILGAGIGITGSFWTGSALILFPHLTEVFFVTGIIATLFLLTAIYLTWTKTLVEIQDMHRKEKR